MDRKRALFPASGTIVRVRASSFAILAIVAACGGTVATVGAPDGGGGTSDSGGGGDQDASPIPDAGADTIVFDDAGQPTCASQLATLDALRQATRKCCPTCNTAQCTIKVQDLCCPIGATNPQAAQVFTDAVKRYLAQCGPIACPAIVCVQEPSNTCDPNTSLCR
jgi:hypothetical protein